MLPGLETTPLIETAEYLKASVDWNRYFRLISAIGDSLNSNKNRFDKSDLLEHSLEIFSGGVVKWIDDVGADHLLLDGTRIEMKYILGSLQGANGRTKKTISSVKLMNSLGTCTHKSLPQNYADYLLISDSHIVCLLDRDTLSRYIVCRGDGLYAERIPFSQVYTVSKGMPQPAQSSSFDYAQEKRQMQKRFIEQVI